MRYSPFRYLDSVLWKKTPIQLTFFLTSRCNAKCPFCFYLSRPGIQNNDPELTAEEIDRISASMGKLLWLAFSGGEIFLRNDLVEITELFYRRNKPTVILLPTNGLLPNLIREKTQEIAGRCAKSTVVLKLSLDGPQEINDSLRGVDGAFRRTLETYRLIGDLLSRHGNLELGVNTVFCSANQERMDEIIAFVEGLDRIRTHTISMIRGDVPDRSLKEIDIEKYHMTVSRLESALRSGRGGTYRFRGAKIKAAQDILQRRLIYETSIRGKRLVPCYAGRLTLVLTEKGDVYPCESFEGLMGNVREQKYDIVKILRSESARAVINSIGKGRCFCTHECYQMMNILFNPSFYPALISEYFRI